MQMILEIIVLSLHILISLLIIIIILRSHETHLAGVQGTGSQLLLGVAAPAAAPAGIINLERIKQKLELWVQPNISSL